jgi:hypothetical protein
VKLGEIKVNKAYLAGLLAQRSIQMSEQNTPAIVDTKTDQVSRQAKAASEETTHKDRMMAVIRESMEGKRKHGR